MQWYFFPFSLLYGFAVSLRNKLFDWQWLSSEKFNLPVISIGNITVGGTGKTPHIEYLVKYLSSKHTVATVSRGYKRKTSGFLEVKANSKVTEVGDEPLQIKQKFKNCCVVVDEKRVNAIHKLSERKNPPEVILLDDAYQHRHVEPGLNILLIDHNRPITKDFMLPAGRLREPAHNSDRANIVILTKCPEDMNPMEIRIMTKELNLYPYQKLFFTTFAYHKLEPIFDHTNKYNTIADLKGSEVILVTGIANPKPIYQKLKSHGAKITSITFADHHNFSKGDINKIINTYMEINTKNKLIVCTEKDAVRLKDIELSKELAKIPVYSLPIEVVFLKNEEEDFNKAIDNYIECVNFN